MVGWQYQYNGYEFEQTLGKNEGQGSLACCSPWGCKESDMTEQLKGNNKRDHSKYLGEMEVNGKMNYFGLNVCVPSKNCYVGALIPNVMAFGGGTL